MKRRVIAFDLDGTLAVTKSAITDVMADRLGDLLSIYEVCVISGDTFDQFEVQVIDHLESAQRAFKAQGFSVTAGIPPEVTLGDHPQDQEGTPSNTWCLATHRHRPQLEAHRPTTLTHPRR